MEKIIKLEYFLLRKHEDLLRGTRLFLHGVFHGENECLFAVKGGKGKRKIYCIPRYKVELREIKK